MKFYLYTMPHGYLLQGRKWWSPFRFKIGFFTTIGEAMDKIKEYEQ